MVESPIEQSSTERNKQHGVRRLAIASVERREVAQP